MKTMETPDTCVIVVECTPEQKQDILKILQNEQQKIKNFEADNESENMKDIAHTEGVLVGLNICKVLWAQGIISHEMIQEEIYHYKEELDNLKTKQ